MENTTSSSSYCCSNCSWCC